MSQPAVFLDRDGVLNVNRSDHVKGWEEFEFLPGAIEAMRQLTRLRVPLVVVTNQAAIGRRLVPRERVDEIHRRMGAELRRAGARLDDVCCCPHDPRDGCGCRKPAPGLLLDAASRLSLDLSRSIFIGDAESDIAAGLRAGCRTILVLTGRGQAALRAIRRDPALAQPDEIAPDLRAAVPLIEAMLPVPAARASGRTPVEVTPYFVPRLEANS